jgi:putative polyhydroxyalkanoate system protein
MSKAIVVTVPHNLGAEAAKKRIADAIEKLRRDYVDKIAHSEVLWTGDRADLRVAAFGQTTTAQIDVLNEALRIEVQLPWILAALSNKIQDALTTTAKDTLKLGPPKA